MLRIQKEASVQLGTDHQNSMTDLPRSKAFKQDNPSTLMHALASFHPILDKSSSGQPGVAVVIQSLEELGPCYDRSVFELGLDNIRSYQY